MLEKRFAAVQAQVFTALTAAIGINEQRRPNITGETFTISTTNSGNNSITYAFSVNWVEQF